MLISVYGTLRKGCGANYKMDNTEFIGMSKENVRFKMLHLGGFPLDESKIIKLYNLCYSLQDEIGQLFPYYVFNTSRYKSNGKDYCKKLPRSVDSIDDLYSFLSDGNSAVNSFSIRSTESSAKCDASTASQAKSTTLLIYFPFPTK